MTARALCLGGHSRWKTTRKPIRPSLTGRRGHSRPDVPSQSEAWRYQSHGSQTSVSKTATRRFAEEFVAPPADRSANCCGKAETKSGARRPNRVLAKKSMAAGWQAQLNSQRYRHAFEGAGQSRQHRTRAPVSSAVAHPRHHKKKSLFDKMKGKDAPQRDQAEEAGSETNRARGRPQARVPIKSNATSPRAVFLQERAIRVEKSYAGAAAKPSASPRRIAPKRRPPR